MNTANKSSIEIVMRQTECYDVKFINDVLLKNKNNELDTIIEILDLKQPEKEKTIFDDMREILNDKEKIFSELQKKS
jgi:hypothetical protein